jgi:hypothetical protein
MDGCCGMRTVSTVRAKHLPNWLRLGLLKAFGCQDGDTSGASVLYHALGCIGWDGWSTWLDHWGSTKLSDGRVAFVSEPYLAWPPAHEAMRVPRKLATATNSELIVIPEPKCLNERILILFI